MRSNRLASAAAAACVSLCFAGPACATPVAFNVTSSAFLKGSGYGVDNSELPALANLLDVGFSANGLLNTFSLDVGQAFTFDFGTITMQEAGTISAGETDNLGVAAVFNFVDPLNGLRAITATGTATAGLLVDVDIDYTIDWTPVLVSFGNGGQFSINMDTLNFRQSGASHTQTATIRLLANSVPEPASLALVAVALAGLAAGGRKKRRLPG